MAEKISVGRIGENIACEYLKKKGYIIISRNYHTRSGEIDIICQKDLYLIFTEVKTRIGDLKGKPYEQVTYHKRKHLKKIIDIYILLNKPLLKKYRFDIVSIVLNSNFKVKNLIHFINVPLP